jgi:hypothetical protein
MIEGNHCGKEPDMKMKALLLSVLMGIALLAGGCSPSGGGVSLMNAQIAFFSVVLPMGLDALSVKSSGTDVLPAVAGELKKENTFHTLVVHCVPSTMTPPATMTTTATGYDAGGGFLVSGTIVEPHDTGTHYTDVYNLNVSGPTPVTSITGTLDTTGSVTTGTISFNGTPYTYNQLMGL